MRKSRIGLVVAMVAGVAPALISVPGGIEHDNVAFDVAPDGKRIVFSAADGDLYIYHLDSKAVDRLTKTKEVESRPAFSPDGRRIVFSKEIGDTRRSIAVKDLNEGRVQLLTDTDGSSDIAPAYSRDGRRIAFARANLRRPYSMGGWTWDDFDIYVVDADGSGLRRLTREKYYQAESPHFTTDGAGVIYSADKNNYPAPSTPLLLEVDAEGARPPHIVGPEPRATKGNMGLGARASGPNVSADGKSLTFVSDRAESFAYDVYVAKRDGSGPRPLQVTGISKYNQNPAFLPDGESTLFLAGTEKNAGSRPIFSLWQVGVNGKGAHRLADSGLFTDPEHWKPKP